MVLSLASNPSCLLVDDELNILPTSSHVRNIEPLPADGDSAQPSNGKDTELKGLADSLADTLVGYPVPREFQSMGHHFLFTGSNASTAMFKGRAAPSWG